MFRPTWFLRVFTEISDGLSFGCHVLLRESPALSLLRDITEEAFGFFVEMECAVGLLALRCYGFYKVLNSLS